MEVAIHATSRYFMIPVERKLGQNLAIKFTADLSQTQQDSMTLQELNELIERVAAKLRVRELEEMMLLGWMLDQQEYQAPRAQHDSMTIQELNELTECGAAQPGVRKLEEMRLLD
jgi:hypothetical protein